MFDCCILCLLAQAPCQLLRARDVGTSGQRCWRYKSGACKPLNSLTHTHTQPRKLRQLRSSYKSTHADGSGSNKQPSSIFPQFNGQWILRSKQSPLKWTPTETAFLGPQAHGSGHQAFLALLLRSASPPHPSNHKGSAGF